MDYGEMLTDSFDFTRNALFGDLRRGSLLLVLYALATSSLEVLPWLLPLDALPRFVFFVLLVVVTLASLLVLNGYACEIYRGARGPPPVEDPVGLALHGVRLLLVSIVFLVPVIVVLLIFGGIGVMGILASGQSQDMSALFSSLATLGLGMLLAVIVWVVVGLASSIAIVRCARSGEFSEAFNLEAIVLHISRIGWVNYVVALLLLWIVLGCAYAAIGIFGGLPVVGWVIGVVIGAAAFVFAARYLLLVFDSAPAP
ncbi:MAG TPA: DUF4013 domain-containing protein [Methanoregulaceae archaeon]|nr:DUF4013 domain-containing protein [Methanoregulaceae archaeon]